MADFINNVAAADQYSAALTIGPDFVAKNAVITVANNPVLMQFAIGKVGSWRWTDEREYFSIPQSFRVGNVIGVKFRNANAGQIARVLATLSGDDDPNFESGIPFSGVLSATGSLSSLTGLTGQINANGSIAAGTGFTINKGTAGLYTINFTNPFAAPPVVFVQPSTGSGVVCNLTNVTAAKCDLELFTSNGIVLSDAPFDFLALPIQ